MKKVLIITKAVAIGIAGTEKKLDILMKKYIHEPRVHARIAILPHNVWLVIKLDENKREFSLLATCYKHIDKMFDASGNPQDGLLKKKYQLPDNLLGTANHK